MNLEKILNRSLPGIIAMTFLSLSLFSCDNKVTPVNVPPEQVAPGIPEKPSPGADASGEMLNVKLSWLSRDLEDDTLEYDLYFGQTADPPLFVESLKTNAIVVSNLEFETRYYWKILARDKYGLETLGPVWAFTTIGDVEVNFDEPVIEEIVRDKINRSTGPLKVSDVMDITELTAYNKKLRSLAGLEYLINLRTLTLNSYYGYIEGQEEFNYDENRNIFQSLAPLQTLAKLVILDLNNTYVSDLTYLSQMDSLRVLKISGAAVNTLRPIERLPSLEELELRRVPEISLSEIDNISSLEYLDLKGSGISSLEGLEGFKDQGKLKTLILSDNGISSVEPLRDLISLEELALDYNNISEIRPLTTLSNLNWLDLESNEIEDEQFLDDLPNLEFLDIAYTDISDLTFLENMSNLQNLDCSGLVAYDLSLVGDLTHLVRLAWDDSEISDISDIRNLTALEEISFGRNRIQDISDLEGLTELRWIFLNSNAIRDILPLVLNPGLDTGDYLWLVDNPLSETTLLTYIPELVDRGVVIQYE